LNRESSERQRALELIQRKKIEMLGSETPSTVRGGGYEDMYNRADVEEAHKFKDRRGGNIGRDRRWWIVSFTMNRILVTEAFTAIWDLGVFPGDIRSQLFTGQPTVGGLYFQWSIQ
jgi:hypothetical protein